MEVKYVKPTTELVQAIAVDMRVADANEVWASNHYTPMVALMKSWEASDYSAVVMVNGEPCVMLGLTRLNVLSETGIPWLLGANSALKYQVQLMKQPPDVIDEMLNICPKLVNYVHIDNKISIRWLKRLGFKFDDPVPHGIEQELFHRFYLMRNDYV